MKTANVIQAKRFYELAENSMNFNEKCRFYIDAAKFYLLAAEQLSDFDDYLKLSLVYLSNQCMGRVHYIEYLQQYSLNIIKHDNLESNLVTTSDEILLGNRPVLNSTISNEALLLDYNKLIKTASPTKAGVAKDLMILESKLTEIGLNYSSKKPQQQQKESRKNLQPSLEESFMLLSKLSSNPSTEHVSTLNTTTTTWQGEIKSMNERGSNPTKNTNQNTKYSINQLLLPNHTGWQYEFESKLAIKKLTPEPLHPTLPTIAITAPVTAPVTTIVSSIVSDPLSSSSSDPIIIDRSRTTEDKTESETRVVSAIHKPNPEMNQLLHLLERLCSVGKSRLLPCTAPPDRVDVEKENELLIHELNEVKAMEEHHKQLEQSIESFKNEYSEKISEMKLMLETTDQKAIGMAGADPSSASGDPLHQTNDVIVLTRRLRQLEKIVNALLQKVEVEKAEHKKTEDRLLKYQKIFKQFKEHKKASSSNPVNALETNPLNKEMKSNNEIFNDNRTSDMKSNGLANHGLSIPRKPINVEDISRLPIKTVANEAILTSRLPVPKPTQPAHISKHHSTHTLECLQNSKISHK